MLYFLIYLWGVLSSVKFALGAAGLVSLVPAIVLGSVAFVEQDQRVLDICSKTARWAVCALVVSGLIPSKDSIKYMTALYLTETVVSEVSELPEAKRAREILNGLLDEIDPQHKKKDDK